VLAAVRPGVGHSSITPPDEVFPEYFLLIVNKFDEVARTPIEEWMRYLKDAEIREDTTAPGLQAARKKLAIMSMTEKERRAYEDYMVSVHAAQDAWETLKEEGRAEGRAEGRKEEKTDIARKLKGMGLVATDISAATGLTVEQIEAL
jgi:predicted transposase/invertase (TIGR01784 family)